MKGKTKIGTWVGFLLILVWCLFPVAWILSLSFKSEGETAVGSPQFLPKDPTFDNYKALWDWPFVGADPTGVEKDFQKALFNSFGISIIATVLSVILATLAAYAIARLEFKGKRLVLSLPLAIWTLSAFFREIPWEMEQAAQVDGATSWQAFRKVIVPLAAPGVFTAAIVTFFFGPDPFNPPYGLLATSSVVVTIPIIIIVLLFQRKIVAGLTSGAVKG